MKPSTYIFVTLRNIGKPTEVTQLEGPMQQVAKQMLEWMLETTMAKSIRIEIARNKLDLIVDNKTAALASMMDGIFDGLETVDSDMSDGN